ncbi:STAS domain-containing protein [bacterium]|nr:STAS domain-containing protein [bacterium]
MDIKVDVKEGEGCNILNVCGDVDVYTSPKVKESINALIEKEIYNIVVNLEDVRYVDSTGLGVLIGALKKVKEHNGNIVLVCTNPQIKKIFQITGLVKIFSIFANSEDAIEALK